MSTQELEEYETKVMQFDDGVITLVYDEYGYVRYATITDKKGSLRVEINRYYNNLVVQIWGSVGNAKVIRATFDFEFEDGEKPFSEVLEEFEKYGSVSDALDDWLVFLKDYLISIGLS
jgi:hypothetical protein|uniref:Uncharacterized protein n=1 Tax=Candidatus Aramenus sulfurataquae TaxID=1326980 RepID=A0A0F2LR89_9CREN|nr:hypothetical protein [Candidatus Aramenus sulfurataquae]